jgi:hypothetical protein
MYLGMVYAIASIGILGFIVWSYSNGYYYNLFYLAMIGYITYIFSNKFYTYVIYIIAQVVLVALLILLISKYLGDDFILYCSDNDPGKIEVTVKSELGNVSATIPYSFTQKLVDDATTAVSSVGALAAGAKVAASVTGGPRTKVRVALGTAVGGALLMNAVNKNVSEVNTFEVAKRLGKEKRLPSARPSSPTDNFFINSPIEQNESSFNLLSHLPNWIKDDIAARVPLTDYNATGEYNVLFMKYNLFVYIMIICVFAIFFGLALNWLLNTIKNNNEFMNKYFPKTLGRLSSSSSLKLIIVVNQVGVLYIFLAIVKCIVFMYLNYIPSDLGTICDIAIKSKLDK